MIYDLNYMKRIKDSVDAFHKTGNDAHLATIIRDFGIDGVLMIQNADITTAYLIQRPDLFNDERIPEHLRERVVGTHLKLLGTDIKRNIKSVLKYLEFLLVGEQFKHKDVEFIKDVARVVRNSEEFKNNPNLCYEINRHLLDILSRKYPDMVPVFIRDIPSDKFEFYSDAINSVITNLAMGASSGNITQILYFILEIINACYYSIVVGDGDDIADLEVGEEIILSEEQWCNTYNVVHDAVTSILDTSEISNVRALMELVHNKYFVSPTASLLEKSVYCKAMKDIALAVNSEIAIWYNDIECVYSQTSDTVDINHMLSLNPMGSKLNPNQFMKNVEFFETAFGILMTDISCAKKLAAVKFIYKFYGCGYYEKVNEVYDKLSSIDSNIDIVYIEDEKKTLYLLDSIINHTVEDKENNINNKSEYDIAHMSNEDKKFIVQQTNPVYDGYLTEDQREIRDIAMGRR